MIGHQYYQIKAAEYRSYVGHTIQIKCGVLYCSPWSKSIKSGPNVNLEGGCTVSVPVSLAGKTLVILLVYEANDKS